MIKNLLLLITLFYSHVLYAQLCQGTYLEMNLWGNSSCSGELAIGTDVIFMQDTNGNWGALIEGMPSPGGVGLQVSGNNITIPQQALQGAWAQGQGVILADGSACPIVQLAYMVTDGSGGYNCNLLSLVYQGGTGSPCNPPTGLAASNITNNSATLTWSAVAGANAYFLQARVVGTSTWSSLGSINSNSASLTGLIPCTSYEVQVQSGCNGTGSAFSSSYVLTTTGCGTGNTYCEVMGNDIDYEWIDRVTIGNMNNLSGADDGYGDYTATTINVSRGNTYPIALYPAFSSDPYTEYWRIWIDYNHDNDFDDSNELVFDSGSASSSSVTGNITVPTNVQLGNTRMRVMMKWVDATDDPALPTPCLSFGYGEVEDYTVSINNVPTAIENNTETIPIKIAYSPTSNGVTITTNTLDPSQVYIYDMQGKLLQAVALQSNATAQVDVQQFPRGIYVVQVVGKGIFYAKKIVLLK